MPEQTLAEQLKAKVDEIDQVLKPAEDEKRPLTEDEQKKLGELEFQREEIKAKIEAADKLRAARERQEAAKKLLDRPSPRTVPPAPIDDLSGGRRIEVPAILARRHRVGRLKAFSGPDALEGAYLSGQWFLATIYGNRKAAAWCEKNGLSLDESLALGETVEGKGGYLVPEPLAAAIIDLREQYGVFRRNARVLPMPSDAYVVPRRTGGLTAYFVGENSEITASDKNWDAVQLTARKLAALCKYSSELAEDAIISIADDLANEIAYAFALKEDQCGFLGTGTSTYGGISGLIAKCAAATATVVTAATGHTAFSTLTVGDFESMIGKLPTYAEGNSRWFISKVGWAASMMRLADAAGGITYAEMTGGRRVPQFLGIPVELAQVMNSTLTAQTSTNGICYLGDLRQAATLGERRGLTLRASADRYFELDQLAIQGTERIDINVHDVGDTTSAGAVVMLATPAS